MTRQTHRLLIGSLGWQHDGWQASFYPEDLPPDWRLGYYSNEFPLAVITGAEQAAADDLAGELADCRADLVVLLVVAPPADEPGPVLAAAKESLGRLPREAGVLLQVEPGAIADPAGWLAQARAVLGPAPLCLVPGGALTDAWREALVQQQIGWSWNRHTDRAGLAIGPLAVIEVPDEADAAQLRECIEAGLAVGDPRRHVAVLFEGQPPSVEGMRQAKILEELM